MTNLLIVVGVGITLLGGFLWRRRMAKPIPERVFLPAALRQIHVDELAPFIVAGFRTGTEKLLELGFKSEGVVVITRHEGMGPGTETPAQLFRGPSDILGILEWHAKALFDRSYLLRLVTFFQDGHVLVTTDCARHLAIGIPADFTWRDEYQFSVADQVSCHQAAILELAQTHGGLIPQAGDLSESVRTYEQARCRGLEKAGVLVRTEATLVVADAALTRRNQEFAGGAQRATFAAYNRLFGSEGQTLQPFVQAASDTVRPVVSSRRRLPKHIIPIFALCAAIVFLSPLTPGNGELFPALIVAGLFCWHPVLTYLHELGHLLTAKFFGMPIGNLHVSLKGGGYTEIGHTWRGQNSVEVFLVLLFGPLLVLILARWLIASSLHPGLTPYLAPSYPAFVWGMGYSLWNLLPIPPRDGQTSDGWNLQWLIFNGLSGGKKVLVGGVIVLLVALFLLWRVGWIAAAGGGMVIGAGLLWAQQSNAKSSGLSLATLVQPSRNCDRALMVVLYSVTVVTVLLALGV